MVKFAKISIKMVIILNSKKYMGNVKNMYGNVNEIFNRSMLIKSMKSSEIISSF